MDLSISWEITMNTVGDMLETFDKLSDNNNNSVLKEEGTSDMEELDDLQ